MDIIISDHIQQNLYGIFVRAAIEESNREIVVLIIMAGSRMMYGNTPTAYTESNIVQVFCGTRYPFDSNGCALIFKKA